MTAPEECEEGPTAKPDDADPSSFAAGCGANANGDGSVAIGDKATTERVNVGDERMLAEGTLTVGDGEPVDIVVEYDADDNVLGYYRNDIDMDGDVDKDDVLGGEAESLAAIVHDLDPNKEDNLVPSHSLDVEGTQVERFEVIVPVKNAVAIGPNATVKGDGGIALGNGATVGRNGKVTRTTTEEVVQTRILAEGTLTVGDGEPVDIVVEYDADDNVLGYYRNDVDMDGDVDKDDVLGGEAESLAAIVHDLDPNKEDNLVPSHSLDVEGTQEVKITEEQVTVLLVDDIPATNGIAIGNGAAVMGDNGIAIGAGVEAGENQIVIGKSDHSAIIAGVDIKQARVDINRNAADIMANAGRITANEGNIAANANGIAANATAIADFDERLMGVDERVKQVAAMSAALSAVPNTVSGDGDFFLGVGFGNSAGQQGIAVGVSARFGAKKNIIINAGAASAGDETSARVGVGFVW